MTFALFLGAGFSKWSGNLPLANQLFDFKIEAWKRESRKLELVKSLKKQWDTKNPDAYAEAFISYAFTLEDRWRELVNWYICRRLAEPFIWKEFHAGKWRRHALMIDENRKYEIQGVKKAQDFLHQFYARLATTSSSGIITTNYDLMVEYALGTRGFNYGEYNQTLHGRGAYPLSHLHNPVTLRGDVALAKIHGSLSWDENNNYTDGRRGITGGALIVPPTPEKQPPVQLRETWNLASDILEHTTHLLIFGFAFNPYDEAVLDLLRSAGKNLASVLIIDIDPKNEQASHLWPYAQITSCPPPPEGISTMHKWLNTNT